VSEHDGWGGNTYKLHWIRDGRAICGSQTKPNIHRCACDGCVLDHGCWTCKARLASAAREGRTT
jgi:hypothetical protein